MKTIKIVASIIALGASMLMASPAQADTTTCMTTGSMQTCTTVYTSGGMSTTTCTYFGSMQTCNTINN